MIDALGRAAASFRLGMEAQGQEAYLAWIDRLAAAPPHVHAAIAPLLPELIAAQTRGDALRLADLLLHEIEPRLEREASARPPRARGDRS